MHMRSLAECRFEARCFSACTVVITQLPIHSFKTRWTETATSFTNPEISQANHTNPIVYLVLDITRVCVYILVCLQPDMSHTGKDLLKAMYFDKCVCCITNGMPSNSTHIFLLILPEQVHFVLARQMSFCIIKCLCRPSAHIPLM